jgi:hypothetical protein
MKTRYALGDHYKRSSNSLYKFTVPKGTPVISISFAWGLDITDEVILPRGTNVSDVQDLGETQFPTEAYFLARQPDMAAEVRGLTAALHYAMKVVEKGKNGNG